MVSYLRRALLAQGVQPPTDAVAKDAVRKTIELMLAIASMSTFDKVLVEDPDSSANQAANPDLILAHSGKAFGIACKSLSSFHESTFLDRVHEGIAQLDRAVDADTVTARCGFVLIDISAILNHEKLFIPEPMNCWDFEDAPNALLAATDEALRMVFGSDPRRTFRQILGHVFDGHSWPPGVLFYSHGVMVCDQCGRSVPVYQKALRLAYAGDTSPLAGFTKKLNCALHGQTANRC